MSSIENTLHTNILINMEHESLTLWDKHDVFKLSLAKNINKKRYIFYDGPPFATGLPHHGHLLASTIKDIIPRYKTMQGYHVPRRFGWDCHGLPIEHEINKSMGMHAHEVVEKLGIAGYNQACRNIVMRFREQWESVIRRIGRWVDMQDDFKTMDVEFMESVWWGFSQLWKQNLIYQGKKVVPYSPALGTVLSNFEAGMNYQDVQDPSLLVRIPLLETCNGIVTHALIWTTTPWTLPSNLALCVHPDAHYVQIKLQDDTIALLLAEERAAAILEGKHYEILSYYKGSDLQNMKYAPLFVLETAKDPMAYRILCDAFVNLSTGTGIVHMAPAFGEEDQRICNEHNLLTSLDPMDEKGCFTEQVPMLQGLPFKEADAMVTRYLKTQALLFHQSTLVHAYPFCPRSDTPLMYRAVPSWYVNVNMLKEDMLKANEQIHWVPEHIKQGRFGMWLQGAKDWAISRNRVWGTPLPLWINDQTGSIICMSSCVMLQQYTGILVNDLHRETVDPLTFSLPGEDGIYKRVTEVLDCWFESGSMPWAQNHYPFKNPDAEFSDFFPADFIAEGLDQTRGWFYTLTVLASAIKKQPAFKNVIVNGLVTANDGKKMSKRLQNYTPPMELMERCGADALRLYLIHSGLVKGEEQRFSDHGVEQIARHTLMPWVNALKFFDTYALAEHWQRPDVAPIIEHPLDRWILSKCSSLIQKIDAAMELYHLHQVVPPLLEFIDDLTNTYIRMNRSRFWGTDNQSDPAAFYTLYTVLRDWTLCMAPFAPLISESIYQRLQTYEPSLPLSVHLNDYPKANIAIIDHACEASIHWLQSIITLGRHQRNDVKIPIKTPLTKITVIHRDPEVLKSIESVANLILGELNVFEMQTASNEESYVDLVLKPNSRIIGKRLGPAFKNVFNKIKQLNTKQIQEAESCGYIDIDGHRITGDEWELERVAKASNIMTNGKITLELDTNLNQTCIEKGKARELLGLIQKYRKHLDLPITNRIHIQILCTPDLYNIIDTHKNYLMQEALCTMLDTFSLDHIVKSDYLAAPGIYLRMIETNNIKETYAN